MRRTARLVRDFEKGYASQKTALLSFAGKVGCSPESLLNWVRQAERDEGYRSLPTSNSAARIKEPVRESRKLKRANEILRAGLKLVAANWNSLPSRLLGRMLGCDAHEATKIN